jgi:hypothetical protein
VRFREKIVRRDCEKRLRKDREEIARKDKKLRKERKKRKKRIPDFNSLSLTDLPGTNLPFSNWVGISILGKWLG